MKRGMRLGCLLLPAAASCMVELGVPDGVRISCATTEDCPQSYRCSSALHECVAAGTSDTPPSIANVDMGPALVGEGTVLHVSFEVDSELAQTPVVEVQWPARVQTLTLDSAAAPYTFRYRADKLTDVEGFAAVRVGVVGENGIVAEANYPRALEFDFTAATVQVTTVLLEILPGADSLLRDVSRLGIGGLLRLHFLVSEALAAEPVVTLLADPALPLICSPPLGLLYTCTTAAALSDGTYGFEVSLIDAAGNPSTLVLEHVPVGSGLQAPLTIEVDTVRPAAPDVGSAGRIVLARFPWGDTAGGPPRLVLAGQVGAVEAGATVVVFDAALAPSRTELARTPADLNGAFATVLGGADRANVYALAVDAAGNAGAPLAADGTSPAVRVRHVEWTATLRGKVAGSTLENPQRLRRATSLPAGVHDLFTVEMSSAAQTDASRVDGAMAAVVAERRFRAIGTPTIGSAFASLVAIPKRGAVVRAGAEFGSTNPAFFEAWSDGIWTALPTGGQSLYLFSSQAIAYDVRRDRMVVVGAASNATSSLSTWEWDGSTFIDVTPTTGSPGGRGLYSVAYDGGRQRVILFGGFTIHDGTQCPQGSTLMPGSVPMCAFNDLWEWDGFSWIDRTPASGPLPPPRAQTAIAYDTVSGLLFLYGGCGGFFRCGTDFPIYDDVWTWDGQTWTALAPSPAGARYGHTAAFDADSGRVVVYGGASSACADFCDDLWRFDVVLGSWSLATFVGSRPRAAAYAGLTYDSARGQLLLALPDPPDPATACAATPDLCGQLWGLSGGAWTPLSALPLPGRTFSPLVFDEARERLVRFGGCDNPNADCGSIETNESGETWEWVGYAWERRCEEPAGGADHCATMPAPRHGHALAYDTKRRVVYLFGGTSEDAGVAYDDLWQWDGRAWTDVCGAGCPGRPPARYHHAMVYDAARDELAVFGGFAGMNDCGGGALNNQCNDMWRWGMHGSTLCGGPSTCWLRPLQSPVPAPRARHTMVYDELGQRVLMFGGELIQLLSPLDCPPEGLLVGGTSCVFGTLWALDDTGWSILGPALAGEVGNPEPRFEHHMVYDAGRAQVLVGGGRAAVTATRRLSDLWQWDGAAWRQLELVGANPLATRGLTLAFDRARDVVVGHGGAPADATTWLWDARSTLRPALVFEASFATAGEPLAQIQSVRVDMVGGGTGYTLDLDGVGPRRGSIAEGMVLHAWDGAAGRWVLLANSLTGVLTSLTGDPVAAASLLTVPERTFYLRLTPANGAGNGPAESSVVLDGVEVTIGYQVL